MASLARVDALRGASGEQPVEKFTEASFSIDEPQKHDEMTVLYHNVFIGLDSCHIMW